MEIEILLIYEPLLPDVDPVRAAQDAQVIAFNIDQRLAELFFLVDDSRDGQKLCRGALQILHGAEQLQKPQLSIVPQEHHEAGDIAGEPHPSESRPGRRIPWIVFTRA